MTFSRLDLSGLKAPPPREHGAVSQLIWVDLADCVVDREYQRDITTHSRSRVVKIAAEFDWSCFSPLIVSPVADGKYAIIDGQHRATAAMLIGETQVPEMVVIADRARQAKSFAAINGSTTKMTAQQVYRAARASKEPKIVEIDAIAAECGVHILTRKLQADLMKPGDLICVQAVVKAFEQHGAESLRAAFAAIMASKGDKRGLISPIVVRGLAMLFAHRPMSIATIRRAFAFLDLRDAMSEAKREGFDGGLVDFRNVVAARLVKLAKGAA